jgi:hypothetical protein
MTSSTSEDQSRRSAAGLISGSTPRIPWGYPLARKLTLLSVACPRTCARCCVNDVLISVGGHDGKCAEIRPPLVFSMAHVDWFCTEWEAALAVS